MPFARVLGTFKPPGLRPIRPVILRHCIELFKSLVFVSLYLVVHWLIPSFLVVYIIAHLFSVCNMQVAQNIQLFFVQHAEFRHYAEFAIDILTKVCYNGKWRCVIRGQRAEGRGQRAEVRKISSRCSEIIRINNFVCT